MKDYEIAHLKKKLIHERQQTLESIRLHKETGFGSSLKESTSELSMYDNHPADMASETYEQEKEFAIQNHLEEHLADIDEALEKIDSNEYGICDFCGKEIGYERLLALPTAKLCIECQNKRTVALDDLEDDRPVEEERLYPPFGRTFTDDTENNVYDGEDAWQDVQKYGTASGPQDMGVNSPVTYKNNFQDNDEELGVVDQMDKIDNQEYTSQLQD